MKNSIIKISLFFVFILFTSSYLAQEDSVSRAKNKWEQFKSKVKNRSDALMEDIEKQKKSKKEQKEKEKKRQKEKEYQENNRRKESKDKNSDNSSKKDKPYKQSRIGINQHQDIKKIKTDNVQRYVIQNNNWELPDYEIRHKTMDIYLVTGDNGGVYKIKVSGGYIWNLAGRGKPKYNTHFYSEYYKNQRAVCIEKNLITYYAKNNKIASVSSYGKPSLSPTIIIEMLEEHEATIEYAKNYNPLKEYETVYGLKNGWIKVRNNQKKYGLLNKSEVVVISPEYDEIRIQGNGYAWLKNNNLWTLINSKGQFITNEKFDNASDFLGNKASVRKGQKLGSISTDGKVNWRLKNVNFDLVFEIDNGYVFKKNNKYGVADKNGVVILKNNYSKASFNDGSAMVGLCGRDKKCGFYRVEKGWITERVYNSVSVIKPSYREAQSMKRTDTKYYCSVTTRITQTSIKSKKPLEGIVKSDGTIIWGGSVKLAESSPNKNPKTDRMSWRNEYNQQHLIEINKPFVVRHKKTSKYYLLDQNGTVILGPKNRTIKEAAHPRYYVYIGTWSARTYNVDTKSWSKDTTKFSMNVRNTENNNRSNSNNTSNNRSSSSECTFTIKNKSFGGVIKVIKGGSRNNAIEIAGGESKTFNCNIEVYYSNNNNDTLSKICGGSSSCGGKTYTIGK